MDTHWQFHGYPLTILWIPIDNSVEILWRFRRWSADYSCGQFTDIVNFLVTCTVRLCSSLESNFLSLNEMPGGVFASISTAAESTVWHHSECALRSTDGWDEDGLIEQSHKNQILYKDQDILTEKDFWWEWTSSSLWLCVMCVIPRFIYPRLMFVIQQWSTSASKMGEPIKVPRTVPAYSVYTAWDFHPTFISMQISCIWLSTVGVWLVDPSWFMPLCYKYEVGSICRTSSFVD